MVRLALLHLVTFVVDPVGDARRPDRAEGLEILLRHQLRLVQRGRRRSPRLARCEKLTLAVLATKLLQLTCGPRTRLDQVLMLVKPETVLGWHRGVIRRKGTMRRREASGRPAIAVEVDALALPFTREHPGWGYHRIQGELA